MVSDRDNQEAEVSGGESVDPDRLHVPVLLEEVVDALDVCPGKAVFDGTVGFGGHAEAILSRIGQSGRFIGVDRDEEALEFTRVRLGRVDGSFFLFRGLFTQVRQALEGAGVTPEGGLDGILLDLGVSSYQLDVPERGFSFQRDGPLDMRMGPDEGVSAAEWLESASVEEIETVLREFGEEPDARRIARAIDRRRRVRKIRRTGELAGIVESVGRSRRPKIHPATKVFQAIRIQVNSELSELRQFLGEVDRYLCPGGRLVVVSYHSLEDRLVKNVMKERLKDGIFEKIKPALVRPAPEEIRENPRSRSARLRVALRRRERPD